METGFIILLSALLVIAMIPALYKKRYSITHSVTVIRPKQEVFDYLRHFNNQNEWAEWIKADPAMKISCSGTDGQEGFMYKWQSGLKNVGKGTQKITKIIDGKRIDYDLFIAGKPTVRCSWLIKDSVEKYNTDIIWVVTGRISYPKNLMMFFFERSVDKIMHKELAMLKVRLEHSMWREASLA